MLIIPIVIIKKSISSGTDICINYMNTHTNLHCRCHIQNNLYYNICHNNICNKNVITYMHTPQPALQVTQSSPNLYNMSCNNIAI